MSLLASGLYTGFKSGPQITRLECPARDPNLT
jgi:hypothetical protein